ncbi:MAG: hypothetical protein DI543_19155 [Bradyrhizobium icense]|nr:MAG: hypothetical protein DI543_19155 [Bradyrhizobium icense]
MMAVVFVRIVLTLLCAVCGGAACLILLGIGHTQQAVKWGLIAAIVAWLIQPSAEDRADFAAFQKSREPWQPPNR